MASGGDAADFPDLAVADRLLIGCAGHDANRENAFSDVDARIARLLLESAIGLNFREVQG